MHIQSIVFSKDFWSEKKAKGWLNKKGYTEDFKGKGTDETESSFRFRQAEPLSKGKQAKGFYYVTEHSKNPKDEGIAYVVICDPKDEIKKKAKISKESNYSFKNVDVGDQLISTLSQGMFNMPMEFRSSIGIIRDGDPLHNLSREAGHHPTLETARAIDKDLFGILSLQNY